jgi:hypothetical protein
VEPLLSLSLSLSPLSLSPLFLSRGCTQASSSISGHASLTIYFCCSKRERGRERERAIERNRERGRDRERGRERGRERETEGQTKLIHHPD